MTQASDYQYSRGTLGDFPGGFFNMHGASVDQEGHLYVAEVGGGRMSPASTSGCSRAM